MLSQADCLRREECIYMNIHGALRALGTQESESREGLARIPQRLEWRLGDVGKFFVPVSRLPLLFPRWCSFTLLELFSHFGLFITPQSPCSMSQPFATHSLKFKFF